MARFLPLLCAPALLMAQTPVDPEAIGKEFKAAFEIANVQFTATVQKAEAARAKSGKPPAGASTEAAAATTAPGQVSKFLKLDMSKAMKSIRAKRTKASGETREGLLLAEIMLMDTFQQRQDPKLVQQLRAIPPSSGAWRVRPTALLNYQELLPEGYLAQVEQQGHPEVRAELAGRDFYRHMMEGKLDEAKALVAKLEKEFPTAPVTKQYAGILQGELATAVGNAAPAFSIANLDDPTQTFTNATFKGKFLLLDFWGTWCGWCVKELPTTHKLYEQYRGTGKFEILSLASDGKAETVQTFRKNSGHPMPWKHALLGRGNDSHAMVKDFGVMGYPSLFLIGPDGKIVARGEDLREEKLAATLKKFLGE